MVDKHTKEQRRKNMQAVKSQNTKIEIILGKKLWSKGFRYRKSPRSILGKPDFAFITKKIAIFCDSEFWHGKDWEEKKYEIKSNRKFWYNKIEKNIERDKIVTKELKRQGWKVLRFWGKEIVKNTDSCIYKIEQVLLSKKRN